jgi:hypothetical protein
MKKKKKTAKRKTYLPIFEKKKNYEDGKFGEHFLFQLRIKKKNLLNDCKKLLSFF